MTIETERQSRCARLSAAVQDVIAKRLTVRVAEEKHNVPKSSIARHVKNKVKGCKRRGRPPALSNAEKKNFLATALDAADRGAPLSTEKMKTLVAVAVENTAAGRSGKSPFKNGAPSSTYIRNLRRSDPIAVRIARPLMQQGVRFNAVNSESVTNQYATLEKIIREEDLTIDRIFNVDEMGMSPERDLAKCSRQRYLLPRRGRSGTADHRILEFVYDHHVTCMPVISASGELGPMLVVFKGDRIPYRVVIRGGKEVVETPAKYLPRRAIIASRKDRGGFDSANFYRWAEVFVDYVRDLTKDGGKVLLTYDGYRAHISVRVLRLFRDNGVIPYALPSHTSGKLQPLDVTVFSSLKAHLRNTTNNCVTLYGSRRIDMFDFCAVFGRACRLSLTQKVLISGFRRSGMWPLNPSRFMVKPLPASNSRDETELVSPERLRKKYQRRCLELRNAILGSDAVISACGFINSSNGCVMTSDRAYELAVEKYKQDKSKRAADEAKKVEKELRDSRRDSKRMKDAAHLKASSNRNRATLAHMTLPDYRNSQRTMKVRRAIAKKKKLDRQSQQ